MVRLNTLQAADGSDVVGFPMLVSSSFEATTSFVVVVVVVVVAETPFG